MIGCLIHEAVLFILKERRVQDLPAGLQANLTPGAQISQVAPLTWRLSIPAGPAGSYRLAQMDDYGSLQRRAFRWKAGTHITLEARACSDSLPGTWGFGLWNDPFSMGILNRAGADGTKGQLRLPALPNTAWFFYASPPSYLSLRDDLPALGWLAATFQAKFLPALALTPAALAVPLMIFPPIVRLARRWARRAVKQDAFALELDPTVWHTYDLRWEAKAASFRVDGQTALHSQVSPQGQMGLVIWVDNQYMALPPSGRLDYGMLSSPEPAWIEVRGLAIQQE